MAGSNENSEHKCEFNEHPADQGSHLLFALVDYDNVVPNREITAKDVSSNLEFVFSELCPQVLRHYSAPEEVHVRLYGGWITELGHLSRRAQMILAQLSNFRMRMGGKIILPLLATSLASWRKHTIVGTVRESRGRKEQKMVDTMIACDAFHLVADSSHSVALISDDDDLLPATLHCATLRPACIGLHRIRCYGEALNDHLLNKLDVSVSAFKGGRHDELS